VRPKFFLPLFAWLAGHACVQAATPQELALQPYTAPAAPKSSDWPRDKLVAFMHDLADFVEIHHVVTDPAHKTYGMVYEFWKDGKKVQEFGLDSLHDGAWFMSSLVVAQRADPQGDWLARAQKYEIPFYANLLNHSDQLFPKMQPTEEDNHPWPMPLKGWAPRGWDDGSGFDRKNLQPLPDAYYTDSNHLSEDLADALLNVWLSTRDPNIAEAARHLRDYKRDYFGPIQGVDIAADITAGQADAFLKYRFPEFSPRSMAPSYPGLFEKKGLPLPTYDDGLAWFYRQATAGALISGELHRGFTAHAVARCAGVITAQESFFDDRPYPYGAWFFDIQHPPAYDGKGKLTEYSSTSKAIYGSRGIQFAWLAAALLPELKSRPALWDNALKLNAGDLIVRLVDDPPVTDGVKDPVYAKSTALGDDSARVALVSDPRSLHIFIETVRPQLTVTFQEENGEPHPSAAGGENAAREANHKSHTKAKKAAGENGEAAHKKDPGAAENAEPPAPPEVVITRGGKLTIGKDGKWTAVNEKGEALLATAVVKPGAFKQGAGESWVAEVRIPYTFVPAQNPWMNGVDFGRYKVGIDLAPPQTICILSESDRIRKRLENCVLGTIDYWHRVWQERGIIPSGWRTPTVPAGDWELSDTGGYAHLIHAIALWVIYQDGNREWEIIREQFPRTSNAAPSLPASVLKAQGLQ
jgi:hypothetical protein